MTLPPFPSQDLAKLVLGYLAEEQLMTAYDEFLQASPYLDALRNEYDRIFMTSLRNILAEYRAVKIYVETCKPLALRKKLVQCTTLLDVVKFLANHADLNKIQAQDNSNDKISLIKQSSSTTSKQSICEVCSSFNLSSCSCKSKQNPTVHSGSHVETSSLDTSVETTALEDLPGNHVTNRKKHVRVLEKECISEPNITLSESTKQCSNVLNNSANGLNTLNSNTHCSQIKSCDNSSVSLGSMVKATDSLECREKIEEFNTILNKVCNNKSKADTRVFSIPQSEIVNKSIPNASNFQDFTSGVCGHENRNDPVPDSSTSENSIALTSIAKDNSTHLDASILMNDVSKTADENSETQKYNHYPYPRIKPNCKDQKIKIISDIKVDKPFAPMNNATSTPLMQTIVINGTPAYKQKLPVMCNNYTKDEIMAMPTIIVVPASGPPPHMAQVKPVLSHKFVKAKTKTVSTAKLFTPLIIDVSSSSVAEKNKTETSQLDLNIPKPVTETGLVKTIDVTKNASVPKDNIIAGSLQTNTPQVLPPVRKSSSTPRRNSHIRVLDFTTPRRILHETINEKEPIESNDNTIEIVDTKTPNVVYANTENGENDIVDISNVKVHKIETCHISSITKDNDNKHAAINKNKNWDADLRALAVANEIINQPPTKTKPRPKKTKKKLAEKQPENDVETDKTDNETKEKKPRSKRKLSPKPRKSKKQKKLEEEEKQYEESASTNDVEIKTTVKPTFNVLAANNYIQLEDNKSHEINQDHKAPLSLTTEDENETPEAERLSLHNEIGARLNISEFLETPYKQVLYDIQMDTPKFLGSVLPDEPISDIKIMNIPTPRFFDTPKPALATPSSYSSRPTDYSSGGSYYKPDEQDYLRITDIECPVTSSKEEPYVEVPKEPECIINKSSRPVRKCTKNVSYVNNCNVINKTKEKIIDDKIEIASSCSDSTSANSSFENNKDLKLKTPKSNKPKLLSKSETKKRLESNRKRKSPMKKDKSNLFMKIKPRRLTPTKENKRTRRKTDVFSQNSSSKPQSKKKLNCKEKKTHITPVIAPAPTKSRRKSSTPRKLHCTKTFNSESSGHESPDISVTVKQNVIRDQNTVSVISSQDSDTEHIALRWSDDGSQDTKPKDGDTEDISKIQAYIETTGNNTNENNTNTGTLQVDLIKRGFDAETAKSIERDLLDASPSAEQSCHTYIEVDESKKEESLLDKVVETDTSVTNELQIDQDAESDDEFELSVHECHEDSNNYIKYYSEAKDISKEPPTKLKDKFNMEVCIDDGVAIRLRATNFNMLFDNDPDNEEELGYSFRETEVAVSSISNIDKLYTPLKDPKAQCYEIFDSTLTSLDTPLKIISPNHKEQKITEIEIVLEEEKFEGKDKYIKRRKRLQSSSSEEVLSENKKTKPEAQYLLNSANIQNIDIESVLTKLHGP